MALVSATFGRALFGAYVYDDLTLIAGNPVIAGGEWWQAVVQPLWGPAFPHWRPLTQVLLAVGHALGGATFVHALALAAHLLAVLVAHRLANRLTSNSVAAFCVALLFGVHPAQAESVAWCAALNDVLCGLCVLLALNRHLEERGRGRAGVSWRVLAWFALGLMAKETALVIPGLLFAIDRWVPSPRQTSPRQTSPRWSSYLAFLLVLLPWLAARVLVFGDWHAGFNRGPILSVAARDAGRLAFTLAGRLLAVLLWPLEPKAMRLTPVEFSVFHYAFVGLTLATISVVVLARQRGAWRVAFGGVAILLPIFLVVSAPSKAGEYPIADRYLYVPVFGLALALASLLRWRRAGLAALLLLAAFYAGRAFVAAGSWASPITFAHAQLGATDLAKADARVLYMLGQIELEAQPPGVKAAKFWLAHAAERVVERRFGGEDGRVRLQADIEAGLAWCAFFAEAESAQPDWRRPGAMFETILRAHEVHAPAHVGLAACLASLGLRADAERHLLRALELEPNFAAARHNLALLRGR